MRAYAAWAVLAAGAAYETQTDLSCASSNAPCPTLWGLTRGLESSVAPFLELEAGANLSLSLSVVTAGTSSPSTTAVALRSDCLDFDLVHVGCVVDDGACEERSVATVSTTAEELATCDGAAYDLTGALTLPLDVDVDVRRSPKATAKPWTVWTEADRVWTEDRDQHGHLRLQMRKMPVPDGGPTDLDEPRRRRK